MGAYSAIEALLMQDPTFQAEVALEAQRLADAGGYDAPDHWDRWLRKLLPSYFGKPFGERHDDFWQWVEDIERDERSAPFVAIWPRGSGKSTNAEAAVVMLAAKGTRRYCMYVCETQDQADKHVANVASMLESSEIAAAYPLISRPLMGKNGNSRGWRRTILRCANGFTVEAVGLNKAVRGGKMDWARPDFIVFDDIDGREDSLATTDKKERTITQSIIPAGAPHVTFLFVQNLVHNKSIACRLAGIEGQSADYLSDRIVSGPFKAVEGLAYEMQPNEQGRYVATIVGGDATWVGQDLKTAQQQMRDWGVTSFLQEAQHEVTDILGGIWDHVVFSHVRFPDLPDMLATELWIDPAVTSTDESDCHAIAAGGIDSEGVIYVTFAFEQRTSPEDSIRRGLLKAIEWGIDSIGIETDQGGDTWKSVYLQAWQSLCADPDYPDIIDTDEAQRRNDAWKNGDKDWEPPEGDVEWKATRRPKFKSAKAGAGHGSKVHRNSHMLADYERGMVVHMIGPHDLVEKALRRFPKTPPHDLADALYWLWFHLQKRRRRSRIG